MTADGHAPVAPLGPKPPNNVQGWLEHLRAQVAVLQPDAEIERSLWGLSGALEQIVEEHRGMAEELLSVYEQLGIVFEVTRKLSTVQHEPEVVDLFVESLRRSFNRRAVFVARTRSWGGWSVPSNDLKMPPWVEPLLDRARERATVVVEPAPARAAGKTVLEVMIGPVFAGQDFVCAIVLTRGHGVAEFRASDMLLLESLTTFCGDLIRNHRLVRELREMSIAMVRSLVNAVDQKDPYTSGHSLRVGYFAVLLGRRLGQSDKDLQMLEWSALLHDVGKIGIREGVLNKEGKLTAEEFDHMKEHPVRSHRVVREVPQLAGALDGVLYHHERYDGTGYPTGLAGEAIPLHARIIKIADVFDALTSDRSYRSAFDWRKALAILTEEAGQTVDPQLCGVFCEMIRERLEGDSGAWPKLVERAEQFAGGGDDVLSDAEVSLP